MELVSINFWKKSHTTIPAETETFKECLVPYWVISTTSSLRSITFWLTPFISLPKITAYFLPESRLKFSIGVDLSACSIEIIW